MRSPRIALFGFVGAFAVSGAAYAAPPSIERAIKELEKTPVCMGREQISGVVNPASEPGEPKRISACIAQTPNSWLSRMVDMRISAACGSVFDIDAAGVPINIETHCDVATAKGELAQDWRKFFETTIGIMTMRAVSAMRYEPADPARTTEKRTDLFQRESLNFKGPKLSAMNQFERTRPRQ